VPGDERVRAPDQFGELFLSVAERFDREVGEAARGNPRRYRSPRGSRRGQTIRTG
jgi:hypothetical protein